MVKISRSSSSKMNLCYFFSNAQEFSYTGYFLVKSIEISLDYILIVGDIFIAAAKSTELAAKRYMQVERNRLLIQPFFFQTGRIILREISFAPDRNSWITGITRSRSIVTLNDLRCNCKQVCCHFCIADFYLFSLLKNDAVLKPVPRIFKQFLLKFTQRKKIGCEKKQYCSNNN